MHLAVIGTGRVGRPTAYTLLLTRLFDEITVVDIKPGLAKAFAEELKHAAVSNRIDISIYWSERDEDVNGADVIVVTAGYPRRPGERITRRELVPRNADIIRYIAEVVPPRNRGARYIIVTNPVDAMAMLFKKISREEFVISTGTHLETLRFRARLAENAGVGFTRIEGWVGGEHGPNPVILWSTVRINGLPVEEYYRMHGRRLDKKAIENYMKTVSTEIIDRIGGTEYGPASAFRDIVKAIVLSEDVYLSIAAPTRIPGIGEPVFVSIPRKLGWMIGDSLYDKLAPEEKEAVHVAAKKIYETYQWALKVLGLS